MQNRSDFYGQNIQNVVITRNEFCNYRFNLKFDLIAKHNAIKHEFFNLEFSEVQYILNIEPEDHSRIDDNRYLMII